MRLLTLILITSAAFSQQPSSTASHGRTPSVSIEKATPQPAETITIPITAAMDAILEAFRASVNDGSTDHSAQLQKLFMAPADIDRWITLLPAVASSAASYPASITISLSADSATELAQKWLSVFSQIPSVSADHKQTFGLLFPAKEQYFIAALKAKGGLFWRLAMAANPAMRSRLATNGASDPVIESTIGQIIQ